MKKLSLLLTVLLITTPAFAHHGADAGHGLITAALHPLIDFDHLLVMLGIGIGLLVTRRLQKR